MKANGLKNRCGLLSTVGAQPPRQNIAVQKAFLAVADFDNVVLKLGNRRFADDLLTNILSEFSFA